MVCAWWSVGGVGPFCQIPGVALYAGESIVKNFAALQRYMIHGGMLRRGHNNCLFIGGGNAAMRLISQNLAARTVFIW